MKIIDTLDPSQCPLTMEEALNALLTPEQQQGELEDLRSQVKCLRSIIQRWMLNLKPTLEELNVLAGSERFRPNAFRTIVAGSRTGFTGKDVKKAIAECGWGISTLVCGEAPGVDSIGKRWAIRNNIPVESFPADWAKNKRSAGHIRNAQMADNAEALIAVWDGSSPGTRSMIRIARKAGLKVHVHIPDRFAVEDIL